LSILIFHNELVIDNISVFIDATTSIVQTAVIETSTQLPEGSSTSSLSNIIKLMNIFVEQATSREITTTSTEITTKSTEITKISTEITTTSIILSNQSND
jgi:hypothetical protein